MKNLPTAPLKMISHKNKYIFVHIPKCGGTSIEKVLCTTENVDLNLDDTTEDFDVNRLSKEDRREYQLKGKTVLLGASACSSARILLNSKSKQHPNGLGNSSDTVGRYLHDSTGAGRSAFVPALMDRKIYNEDGVGGLHVYSPWWLDNKKLDFPRGYHIEIGGGLGPFAGKVWRVGLMGYSAKEENVNRLLKALKDLL